MPIKNWVLGALALVASTGGARATIFDFSFSGANSSGSGYYDTSSIMETHWSGIRYAAFGSFMINGNQYTSVSGWAMFYTAGPGTDVGYAIELRAADDSNVTLVDVKNILDGATTTRLASYISDPIYFTLESNFTFNSAPRIEGAPLSAAAGLPALALLGGIVALVRRRRQAVAV